MTNSAIANLKINEFDFQRTKKGKIDATKYTLYEVLFDPQLNKLSWDERFKIFQEFNDDADRINYTINRRYSTNGPATECDIYDPAEEKIVKMLNFASNNYLNMTTHPKVINAAKEALEIYGTGSGASCVTTGRTKVISDLEQEIAETFEYDQALVYPTGYMTNTGVLNGILRSNDVAIVDMLAHASIIDGVENRNKIFFRHNNMRSLEEAIIKASSQYSNKIIVVDGVYSMDGDIANLPEIAGLCKKYNCKLMVDEAHAFGVIGKNGLGIADHFNMPASTIDIHIGTLSKAIGSSGGFVTGKKEIINYLRFGSRPYFFTTAPFIPAIAAALESFRIIKSDHLRREKLWNNIRFFRSKIRSGNFDIGPAETAIFPVILGDHHLVMKSAWKMGTKGVLAVGVPYPAVSKRQTRIRMIVNSEMNEEQLDKGYGVLLQTITELKKEIYLPSE